MSDVIRSRGRTIIPGHQPLATIFVGCTFAVLVACRSTGGHSRPDGVTVALRPCDTISTHRTSIALAMPLVSSENIEKAVLVGVVVDRQTGSPIEGAVVRVLGSSVQVGTDSAGGFLAVLGNGQRVGVEVVRIGYMGIHDTIDLRVGIPQERRYELRYWSCP